MLSTGFKMAFNRQQLCVTKFIMNPVRFSRNQMNKQKRSSDTQSRIHISNNLLQTIIGQ